jgi:hypothetical protein
MKILTTESGGNDSIEIADRPDDDENIRIAIDNEMSSEIVSVYLSRSERFTLIEHLRTVTE